MKNSLQNPYVVRVTIATILLAMVSVVIFNVLYKDKHFTVFPFIIALFYVSSLLVNHLMQRLSEAKSQKFIAMYTLFSGVKLLFYLVSLLIFMLSFRQDALLIAFTFGACYVVYTGLEIYSALKIK